MNSDKPILKLMDDFLACQDIRENSRKKYRDNLHVFIGWITKNIEDVRNIQKSDIIQYKEWLIKSGRTASTIDNYLAPVRQFFKYLAENDIHKNISVGVRSPKREGYSKDYLRPAEANRLLASINRATNYGLRDHAIINLMLRTGMRCVEVSRANVRDLRIEDEHWVLYIQGKGRWAKDRALGVTPKIVDPIAEYIDANTLREDSPMFLNHSYVSRNTRITTLTISKIVKKYLRAIGINSIKVSAHSLRHTAAITALKSGADILAVKSMLGHRKVETTMIYQRAIEEERGRDGTAIRLMDNAY